jgi:hypothetical protein
MASQYLTRIPMDWLYRADMTSLPSVDRYDTNLAPEFMRRSRAPYRQSATRQQRRMRVVYTGCPALSQATASPIRHHSVLRKVRSMTCAKWLHTQGYTAVQQIKSQDHTQHARAIRQRSDDHNGTSRFVDTGSENHSAKYGDGEHVVYLPSAIAIHSCVVWSLSRQQFRRPIHPVSVSQFD